MAPTGARTSGATPSAYWVYNLYDLERRDAQVGMASDLATRLAKRWKATIAKGFVQDLGSHGFTHACRRILGSSLT